MPRVPWCIWNLNPDGLVFSNTVVTIDDSEYVEAIGRNVISCGDVRYGYHQFGQRFRAKKINLDLPGFSTTGGIFGRGPSLMDDVLFGLPEPLGNITVDADVTWTINCKVQKVARPMVQVRHENASD